MVLMVRNMPNAADADDDESNNRKNNDDDADGAAGVDGISSISIGGSSGSGSASRRPTMERRQSSASSTETANRHRQHRPTRGGGGGDRKMAAVGSVGGGVAPGLPRSPPVRLSRVAVGALPPQAQQMQARQQQNEKKMGVVSVGSILHQQRRRSSGSSGLSSTNADRASSPSSTDNSEDEHEHEDENEHDGRIRGDMGGPSPSSPSSLLLDRSFRAYIDSLPPPVRSTEDLDDLRGHGHGRSASSSSASSSFSSAASSTSSLLSAASSSLAASSTASSSRSSLASSVASSVLSDASSLIAAGRRRGGNRDGDGRTQRKYKHSVSKDLHNGLLLGRRWTENRRVDGERGAGSGGGAGVGAAGGRGGREAGTGTVNAAAVANPTDPSTTTRGAVPQSHPPLTVVTRGLVDPTSLSAKASYFASRPDAVSDLAASAPRGMMSGQQPRPPSPSPPPPAVASAEPPSGSPRAWGAGNDDEIDALLPRQLRRPQHQQQQQQPRHEIRTTRASDFIKRGNSSGRLYRDLHQPHHHQHQQQQHRLHIPSLLSPVLAVCALQSCVRCHLSRRKFLSLKGSVVAVQSAFRMRRQRIPYLTLRNLARRAVAPPLTRVQSSVLTIQSAYRMSPDRRKFHTIKRGAETLQQTLRGRYVHRMFMMYIHYTRAAEKIQRRWRVYQERSTIHDAASALQSIYRGRRNRFAFLCLVVDLLPQAQAAVRGYVTRNVMRRFRRRRVNQYRQQIFALWRRCHTPLVYRSQFWTYVMHDDGGDGFLILGVYEEELTRLWDELGVLLPSFQLQHHAEEAEESSEGSWEEHHGRRRRIHRTSSAGSRSRRAVYVREGLVEVPSTPVSRIFQSVQVRLDAQRIGASGRASARAARARRARKEGPIFPAEVDAAEARRTTTTGKTTASVDDSTVDGMKKHHLQEAEEQLVKERMELYKRLGKKSYATLKEESLILFRIKEGEKRKKQKIIGLLWKNPELAHRSARIVLCLHRDGSSCPGGMVGGISIRCMRSKARPKEWWRSSMFRFPTSTSSVAVATESEWAQRKVEARIHRHLVELADYDPPVLPSSSSTRRRHRQKTKKGRRGLHRQDRKYHRSILRRSHYDQGVRRVDSETFARQREAITGGMYDADWPEHRFIIIRRYLTYGRWYSKGELLSQ